MARNIVRRQRSSEEAERLAASRPDPSGGDPQEPPEKGRRAASPVPDWQPRRRPDGPRRKVALFATCLVDLFRPSVGFASVRLLAEAGCEVVVPPSQTCCGQPAYNSGDRGDAKRLAKRVIRAFQGYDAVVVPSGSCGGMIVKHYPELFEGERKWGPRARALAEKTHELTAFLADELKAKDLDARYDGVAAYHDSCSSLREMGVRAQPRKLLKQVKGLGVRDLPGAEVCCGFGGTFCVKYPDISNRMAADKIEEVVASGADTLLAADMGCLLNLAGKLSRDGHGIHVYHIAEVLAGMADAPGIEAPAEPAEPAAE